ncbi:MAG: triose-phosphate isomerase [Rhodospirillaceae bacterium]|nr:triose-phosphate isomerase [Rhodospirillaceae bacterium]
MGKGRAVGGKLIAGNWKMNGMRADGVALALAIADWARQQGGPALTLLLCPPATLIGAIGAAIAGSPVVLGAQDCHPAAKGAHTGDIAASMLADLGCRYVIVGHSERRQNHHETDALVAAKGAAAHKAGLIAIVCVGETEAERDRGEALAVVSRQLEGSLPEGTTAENSVIAYEPVWAIGTGRVPAAADVGEMHGHMRRLVAKRLVDGADLRLLYGGSVKADNAAELLAIADVDGALVGGASLDARAFTGIAAAVR